MMNADITYQDLAIEATMVDSWHRVAPQQAINKSSLTFESGNETDHVETAMLKLLGGSKSFTVHGKDFISSFTCTKQKLQGHVHMHSRPTVLQETGCPNVQCKTSYYDFSTNSKLNRSHCSYSGIPGHPTVYGQRALGVRLLDLLQMLLKIKNFSESTVTKTEQLQLGDCFTGFHFYTLLVSGLETVISSKWYSNLTKVNQELWNKVLLKYHMKLCGTQWIQTSQVADIKHEILRIARFWYEVWSGNESILH